MQRDDIAEAILERRDELVRDLLATERGAELASLEEAYRALAGKEPPPLRNLIRRHLSVEAEPSQPEFPGHSEEKPVGTRSVPLPAPPKAVPVKEAARNLMKEHPGEWDYDSILGYFKKNHIALRAENPRDALRTAMLGLVDEGVVEKAGRGRYRTLPKFSAETEARLPPEG